jgi:hypothetical protein
MESELTFGQKAVGIGDCEAGGSVFVNAILFSKVIDHLF